MKSLLLSLGVGLGIVLGAKAQSTVGYVSGQDNAPATNYSQVVFPGAPTKSIVLKSIDFRSDTNTAHLYLFAGTTPYTVTGVINGTQLVVSANSGVISNQLAILQFGTTTYVATVLFTNQLTNIWLAGGSTLGFTPPTNAVFWNATNRHVRKIDVTSGNYSGDSLFAAQVRAPLVVRIDPGVVTSNRLNATVRYLRDADNQ